MSYKSYRVDSSKSPQDAVSENETLKKNVRDNIGAAGSADLTSINAALTDLATAINDEVTRATKAEDDLNTSLSKDISDEVTNRTNQYNSLNTLITNLTSNLANYYLKTETYSAEEVDNLIGAINQFKFEIYASLESITKPSSSVLYLIGPDTSASGDQYEEYVYANSAFTKIGDTSIDLSSYSKAFSLENGRYITIEITYDESDVEKNHPIYTIKNTMPKVEIVSTDKSIGVTEVVDAENNIVSYDISLTLEDTEPEWARWATSTNSVNVTKNNTYYTLSPNFTNLAGNILPSAIGKGLYKVDMSFNITTSYDDMIVDYLDVEIMEDNRVIITERIDGIENVTDGDSIIYRDLSTVINKNVTSAFKIRVKTSSRLEDEGEPNLNVSLAKVHIFKVPPRSTVVNKGSTGIDEVKHDTSLSGKGIIGDLLKVNIAENGGIKQNEDGALEIDPDIMPEPTPATVVASGDGGKTSVEKDTQDENKYNVSSPEVAPAENTSVAVKYNTTSRRYEIYGPKVEQSLQFNNNLVNTRVDEETGETTFLLNIPLIWVVDEIPPESERAPLAVYMLRDK